MLLAIPANGSGPEVCVSRTNFTSDRSVRFAFMHIGKNAGSSFRRGLIGATDHVTGERLPCAPCSTHYDFSFIEDDVVKGRLLPVAVLRHPVDRAISHFYFARTLSWTAGNPIRTETLEEYLDDPQTMLETRGVWQDGQAAVLWFAG